MESTYAKTCPGCSAENDGADLFCRECGTSLASVSEDSQHTATFTPVDINADYDTQTTAITPAPPPPSYDTGEFTSVPNFETPSYSYAHQMESPRGAVLGWLAATLMLIILAAFIWSSIISESTRNSITGIF